MYIKYPAEGRKKILVTVRGTGTHWTSVSCKKFGLSWGRYYARKLP